MRCNQKSCDLESGHLALSLGLQDLIQQKLDGIFEIDPRCRRQWGFRLARLQSSFNPYGHLIAKDIEDAAAITLQSNLKKHNPLVLELSGGIGDQLETLSLVLPWTKRFGLALKVIVEPSRLSLISALHLKDVVVESASEVPIVSQSMVIRHAILNHSPNSCFKSFLQLAIKDTPKRTGIVCCWRAEGRGNKLSAHSRSVPFPLVHAFYCKSQAQTPEETIFDISRWKPWEENILKNMGIRLIDPRNRSLIDLAELCQGRRVITIDTALAHLCSACSIPAELLLPLFADERWVELLQPKQSYGKWLKVRKSNQFGAWDSVMESLI